MEGYNKFFVMLIVFICASDAINYQGNVIERNNIKNGKANFLITRMRKKSFNITDPTIWEEHCKLYEAPNVITYKDCSPLKVNLTYCSGSCRSMFSPSYKGVSGLNVCRSCSSSKKLKIQLFFNCSGTINTDIIIDRITECKCSAC